MTLFSSDPNAAPADRASDMLFHRAGIWHDGLKWRADTLRSLAEQLDALDELIQDGVGTVLAELGRSSLPQREEQDG